LERPLEAGSFFRSESLSAIMYEMSPRGFREGSEQVPRSLSAIMYEMSPNCSSCDSSADAQCRYPCSGSASSGVPSDAYRATAPTRTKPISS